MKKSHFDTMIEESSNKVKESQRKIAEVTASVEAALAPAQMQETQ